MQSYKFQEIIDRSCEKKNLDKNLMKSMSDFIWKETKSEMTKFSNLRIYLSGFVAWYYGLSRLKDFKVKVQNKREGTNKEVKNKDKISYLENLTSEELTVVADKVDNLLQVYEVYIEDKNVTKTAFREEMKRRVELKMQKNDIHNL